MKLTLVFAAALIAAYALLSTSLMYIPTQNLLNFGAALDNLLGFITYAFVHISPMHLLGNVLLLIPIGIIAEKKLRIKDYIAIFFISSAVSAAAYFYMNPENVLVGASSAISGLIAAGFMVDVKKAVVAILLSSLLIYAISPSVTTYTQEQLGLLQDKSIQLEQNITQINNAIQEAIQNNDTQKASEYVVQKENIVKIYDSAKTSETNLETGVEREKKSSSSPIVHVIGALTGVAYLFAFRREIIWEMPYQLISRKRSRRN